MKIKKTLSMIAAALTTTLVLSLASVPASAEQIDEQYVTEEDGQTVVNIVTYVEQDNGTSGQSATWYDANGTKFVHTYKERPQQDLPDTTSYVTWEDGAGNRYVRDEGTQTVTVYDTEGNVTAVLPA